MRIKYLGGKEKVSINFFDDIFCWTKGEVKEVSDEFGKFLLEVDGPDSVREEVEKTVDVMHKDTGKPVVLPDNTILQRPIIKKVKNPHPNFDIVKEKKVSSRK